jgi:hypothetical protein
MAAVRPDGGHLSYNRFVMPRMARVLTALALGALLLQGAAAPARPQPTGSFAARVALLSEPGGFFDTDNLISNERSYLDVLPELRRAGVRGGAYIGVGPDQNFSYIAAVRPSIAFMVDIRRDSLLLHLLFKALFQTSRTRVEYLSNLCGRPAPRDLESWKASPIDRLIRYVDSTPADERAVKAVRGRLNEAVAAFGVPLTKDELATIERFHRRFIAEGLGLRFQSFGRPPQTHYPTYRELLSEPGPDAESRSYLATEAGYQFVRDLQRADLVVPVVGDLSGTRALQAIGRFLKDRGERVTALYASNVEQYLFRDGVFPRFVENLRRLPLDDRSVIIRSVFSRGGSSSHVQGVPELLRAVDGGRVRWYQDLMPVR